MQKLKVLGTQLVGEDNKIVQLKGISTHGLSWYPEFVNEPCFRQFHEEWKMNAIRLAMYTAEENGYCTGGNQAELKELVCKGVEYAKQNDMYVIIDWHILADYNPNMNKEAAIAFFDEMSRKFADCNHVLYEICNEPNGDTTWAEVKAYAMEVIQVIRANDKDAVIIVGTPTWSQDVDIAAEDPITGYENIMYTLHYYAATHKEELRGKLRKAIDMGLPVFVSEYGICDASGNGIIDEKEADIWVDLLNEYHISYFLWNLSVRDESSAILKPECKKLSGFTADDLRESGTWLYRMLTK